MLTIKEIKAQLIKRLGQIFNSSFNPWCKSDLHLPKLMVNSNLREQWLLKVQDLVVLKDQSWILLKDNRDLITPYSSPMNSDYSINLLSSQPTIIRLLNIQPKILRIPNKENTSQLMKIMNRNKRYNRKIDSRVLVILVLFYIEINQLRMT